MLPPLHKIRIEIHHYKLLHNTLFAERGRDTEDHVQDAGLSIKNIQRFMKYYPVIKPTAWGLIFRLGGLLMNKVPIRGT